MEFTSIINIKQMDKTATTELHRLFLIEALPDPLTPASRHLQIFDNYLAGTRLRLRKIRDPPTKAWTRILQQRFPAADGHRTVTKLSEIYLNETEYAYLERFEGREIRKNRYFHEVDNTPVIFDIYLGGLWGLNTARVDFQSAESMAEYIPPPLFVLEVSNEAFFSGEVIVDKNFDDVQAEVARIGREIAAPPVSGDI